MLKLLVIIFLFHTFEFYSLINFISIGVFGWVFINGYIIYTIYQKISKHYDIVGVFYGLIKLIFTKNIDKFNEIIDVIMKQESNKT